MKRILVLLTLIAISNVYSFAQDSKYILRHVDGIQAIKIGEAFSFGKNKKTYTTILGYNYYLSKKLFIDASINFETGTVQNTDVRIFYLRINANYTLFQVGNTLFFNAAGGFSGGLEKVNSKISNNNSEASSFCAGANVGLTTEIFLSNTICIEPFVYQYFQFNSEIGHQFYNYGLNLKINF